MHWTAIHFLFSFGVGVKKHPLFSVFLPGVLFFSIQNCLMMQTQSAYLNRPSGFYRHSSAETKTAHFCQTILTCSAPTRLDELMNVGLLALAIQMMPVCVCISVTLILFCSLPFPKPLHRGRHPRVQLVCQCVSVALKATESPCWVNATAGLEQIKKSVFTQRKCGK